MSIAPGPLLDISGAGDPVAIAQTNFEVLTRELFAGNPTFQTGIATTIIGPPTTGAHVLNEFWRDAWLGLWRCTVAGTPGTWRQERPAVQAGEPLSGTIPTGYLILDSTDNYRAKFHDGSYLWRPVFGPYAKLVTKTGAYAVTKIDATILADTTSAGFTVQLPSAASVPSQIFSVKKISSDGNTLTLNSASGNIDGSASKTTTTQYAGWTVQSDGSNYFIIF